MISWRLKKKEKHKESAISNRCSIFKNNQTHTHQKADIVENKATEKWQIESTSDQATITNNSTQSAQIQNHTLPKTRIRTQYQNLQKQITITPKIENIQKKKSQLEHKYVKTRSRIQKK